MFIFTKVAHSKFAEMHGDTSDFYQSASKSDQYFVFKIAIYLYRTVYMPTDSAGFTYRLNRLKPRASKFRGSPARVYNIFNTVIGLSHLCCHNVMYFLNNPSVIFLTQLHSISEYCRILNTPHYLSLIEID